MALFGKKQKEEEQTAVSTTDTATVNPQATAGSCIIRPHITEKAFAMSQRNVYTFVIRPGTNKHQVKAAIKAIYNVTPAKVNVVHKRPRTVSSLMRRTPSHQKGVSKAYVYLKDGDTISFM